MSEITQIKVNNIIYDIRDNSIPAWAKQEDMTVKHNLTEYWNNHRDFIPKAGELIVYDDFDTMPSENEGEVQLIPNIKVGDGNAFLIDLPFIDAKARQTITDHINDSTVHITDGERLFWNNKVTCFLDTINTEQIVFTKD